ncbi:hypothetical protein [Streptomyces mangrovisoli]|uniref:SseB protein N-terminal domain-containing protein n=1 Tax=Streptomyces mangrovisoli TaxID=1428628 RepID=A0A1J4P1B0_9ACTN|nr:hypothetical protein [Streptomyces mangrovisoli]OIJ67516.1 hypothetical protein WN71_013100 [Streptomyces mangrovisoli]
MTEPGGGAQAPRRRSKLADYAAMTAPADDAPHAPLGDPRPLATPPSSPTTPASPAETDARRRRFAGALEAFRETAVLVPVRDNGWLTADFGGVRWILAFSDEAALARYALARGEGREEWAYQTVLGARLLDVAVPEAGLPCGVALDAADGAERALLLPPVTGIVPDACAVNR